MFELKITADSYTELMDKLNEFNPPITAPHEHAEAQGETLHVEPVEPVEPTEPAAPKPAPYGTDHKGRVLDKEGYYHDPEIHSSNEKMTAKGVWTRKRGVSDLLYNEKRKQQDQENTPKSIFASDIPQPVDAHQPADIPQPVDAQNPTDEEIQAAQAQYTSNHGPDATDGILKQYGVSSGTQLPQQLKPHLIQYLTMQDQNLRAQSNA